MRPTDQLQEWEWIEAYYRGELSTDERLIFEQELSRDPQFQQTCEELLVADRAMRTLGLEQTVRAGIASEMAGNRPQRRWRTGRLAGAILSCLLLLTSYYTFSRVDLNAYQNDVTLTQRYRDSDGDGQATNLTSRQRAFYRDFFDAQAYLVNGEPQLATPKLEKLARADSLRPYFRQAVQWHLLNAYLLNRQPDNAQATLLLLQQSGELVYPVSLGDRWKVWWQIRWQKLTE